MLGHSDGIQLKNMDVMDAGRNSPLYLHVLAYTEPLEMEQVSIPERCIPQNWWKQGSSKKHGIKRFNKSGQGMSQYRVSSYPEKKFCHHITQTVFFY